MAVAAIEGDIAPDELADAAIIDLDCRRRYCSRPTVASKVDAMRVCGICINQHDFQGDKIG